jgi:uncharacterized membrane protein AbrB (regulator of aidB expression)
MSAWERIELSQYWRILGTLFMGMSIYTGLKVFIFNNITRPLIIINAGIVVFLLFIVGLIFYIMAHLEELEMTYKEGK